MPQELAKKVRAKYPGVYDDLSDAELEAKVLAKYPEYKDLATETPEVREPGLIRKAWGKATTPIVDIRAEPHIREATEQFAQEHPIIGGIGNFATDVLSSLSSPLNLAFGGLGAGEAVGARIGLPAIAKMSQIGRRALSVPVGIEGAQNLYGAYESGSPMQGITGGLELVGGLMGMRKGGPTARPGVETPIRPEVSPEIAAPIATGKVPTQITFEDMFGPGPHKAPLVTPEGIQAAFKTGKISQEQAVRLLEKSYAEEIAKAKPTKIVAPKPAEVPAVTEPITPEVSPVDIPPVKALDQLPTPPGLTEVIKAIPETGNTELDDMVRSLRAMRRRKGIDQFNELETQAYNGLMDKIKNHPNLPEDLRAKWTGVESTVEAVPSATVEDVMKLMKSRQVMNVSELRSKLGVSFNEARAIWYKAKKQIEETKIPEGFFEHMKPEETKPIVEPTTAKSPIYIIKAEKATAEFIQKTREKGYEFLGLNDKGDYRFQKAVEPIVSGPRSMRPDLTINLGRGAYDPVRVVFADPIDKTVFQALSKNKEGGLKNPGVLENLEKQFPDVSPQQVRVAAHQFRDDVIAQAKALPKQAESGIVGDLKIEPAKSFRDRIAELIKSEKGELIIPGREGNTTIVKSGEATPEVVKKLFDAGFRFQSITETGDLRFKKIGGVGEAPILESEVGLHRPTRKAIMGELGAVQDAKKSSIVMEAFNLPRGVMASWDFSAPLRQGLPLIHKREFWNAMKPMFESWMSEEGFQASQANIANRPLFKKRIDALGEKLPSFADDAGLKLTDLIDLSKREEAIMSTWAEKVPMVRASNRAYTAFLNNLRADVFESLIRDSNVLGANVRNNLPLARSIADFVNTATGRGSLGKLEQHAILLNTGLFAPRLIASRIKMLNPAYYIMAPPLVRKEALKSLFAIAAVGNTVLQLAKMAGAEVGTDPNSADFGKAIIGNTRIDPWGGFQQYVVAANRLIRPSFAKVPGMEGGTETGITPIDLATGFAGTGGWGVTSSRTGRQTDIWNPRGPYGATPLSVSARLLRGKTNPVLGFAWSILDNFTELSGRKMKFATMNPMENSIAQRFIPILMQDVYQLAKENPELLPLAIPATFGMGIQTYEQQ